MFKSKIIIIATNYHMAGNNDKNKIDKIASKLHL